MTCALFGAYRAGPSAAVDLGPPASPRTIEGLGRSFGGGHRGVGEGSSTTRSPIAEAPSSKCSDTTASGHCRDFARSSTKVRA